MDQLGKENKMKVPAEWLETLKTLLFDDLRMTHFGWYHRFRAGTLNEDGIKELISNKVEEYMNHPFNTKWEIPNYEGYLEKFKGTFIGIAKHQLSKNMHPLTCGSDSNHQNLFPRISIDGHCIIVCADCGYVQPVEGLGFIVGKHS
jgi:hypothetical protein